MTATRPARTELVPVRRPDGSVRMLARLHPVPAAEYDALVAALAPRIERALGPEVMANRALGRGLLATTRLEPWRPARAAWRRTLSRSLASPVRPTLLVADVRHCYASIRAEVLAGRLRALGAEPEAVDRVRELLERFGDDGLQGLPVGPAASALLANAVLAAVDEGLRRAGVPHVRWVDDVVAFATGRLQATASLDALRWALDAVGLDPHPRKTEILTDRSRIRERLLNLGSCTGGGSAVG